MTKSHWLALAGGIVIGIVLVFLFGGLMMANCARMMGGTCPMMGGMCPMMQQGGESMPMHR